MLRAEWNELIQMTVASCGLERAPSYEGCFMLQLELFLLAGARRAFRSIAVQVFGAILGSILEPSGHHFRCFF